MLLLSHGTGGDENDLLPLGRELLSEATLLSPRGKVLEGGMPRFFRRLAEGVFDQEDLAERTHELAGFVEAASRPYGFDADEVWAVGFSNGAKIGDTWVHLRECLICGHVGCCDSSKNKHATAHFHRTEHPIVASFEPGEDWRYCYIDGTLV